MCTVIVTIITTAVNPLRMRTLHTTGYTLAVFVVMTAYLFTKCTHSVLETVYTRRVANKTSSEIPFVSTFYFANQTLAVNIFMFTSEVTVCAHTVFVGVHTYQITVIANAAYPVMLTNNTADMTLAVCKVMNTAMRANCTNAVNKIVVASKSAT